MNESKQKLKSKKKNDSPLTGKKQWVYMLVFVIIAVMSVSAILMQSKDFSLADFADYIQEASVPELIAAGLSMLGFIFFEGAALLLLCKAFGHKQSLWRGYIYSASDIYFSAITPSASGGQPASAYFMMKDGMNSMMVAALLVANLCMYMLAIVVIGFAIFFFRFDIFMQFGLGYQILIVAGFLIQVFLLVFFYMLLKKDRLLHRMCSAVISFLCKIRILRNKEGKLKKLEAYMKRYKQHSEIISGHKKTLFFCFVFNLLQRISQIAVTMFVYAATTGKSIMESIDVFFVQCFVTLGANSMPIPGAMGVSDMLMLDGFSTYVGQADAANLVLLSRAFSFYSCVIICGVSTLIQYLAIKKRRNSK